MVQQIHGERKTNGHLELRVRTKGSTVSFGHDKNILKVVAVMAAQL